MSSSGARAQPALFEAVHQHRLACAHEPSADEATGGRVPRPGRPADASCHDLEQACRPPQLTAGARRRAGAGGGRHDRVPRCDSAEDSRSSTWRAVARARSTRSSRDRDAATEVDRAPDRAAASTRHRWAPRQTSTTRGCAASRAAPELAATVPSPVGRRDRFGRGRRGRCRPPCGWPRRTGRAGLVDCGRRLTSSQVRERSTRRELVPCSSPRRRADGRVRHASPSTGRGRDVASRRHPSNVPRRGPLRRRGGRSAVVRERLSDGWLRSRPCRRRASPAALFSSGLSAMTASVVRNSAAIDAAFCSAERVTLAASMTPALQQVLVVAGGGVEALGALRGP